MSANTQRVLLCPVQWCDAAPSSVVTSPSSGASANEPTAQECCHGDEGGLPEAP